MYSPSAQSLFLMLTVGILGCTKPTDEGLSEDSQATDSLTPEDSATVEDTEPPTDPEVTLRFYTSIALGGFDFRTEEGYGFGSLTQLPPHGMMVHEDKPGVWSVMVISPDLTACNQGETALVNDGEIYDWAFSDLPGEYYWEEWICVMP